MIYLLSPLQKEGTLSLPMISFTLLEEQRLELDGVDLLMFTSKQAVKSAEALNPLWKTIPCLAIGSATAKQIERLGGKVLFQPAQFYGERLSEEIVTQFCEQKILYLRPKEVSFDAKRFLYTQGIKIEEQIIYETSCQTYMQNQKPKKGAIIVFTSPSTIRCFLKNFSWDESYTAVVIGEATLKHLPQDIRYAVAKEQTIDACIRRAKELLTPNRL